MLYPNTLVSMARVVKPTTGRAVLLTYDKTSMFKVRSQFAHRLAEITILKCTSMNGSKHPLQYFFQSLGKINPYWKSTRQIYANIGGLAALVFTFTRTDKTPPPISEVEEGRKKGS